MKESEIERYFVWAVQKAGGKTWKFTSPANRGVADRIACFPDGTTWFVELKRPGGRLSALQAIFADDMIALKQNYVLLWNKEEVNAWLKSIGRM